MKFLVQVIADFKEFKTQNQAMKYIQSEWDGIEEIERVLPLVKNKGITK